jgi:hypothetical protein
MNINKLLGIAVGLAIVGLSLGDALTGHDRSHCPGTGRCVLQWLEVVSESCTVFILSERVKNSLYLNQTGGQVF